ncbi:glycoside hydrolase family 17 protein [Pseudomonas sp. RL_15y_Pfl2_60]|uniref:glycoside hydrolase family 17 protein n=1 Tax=Pseudomonas sp. RL_15y_Pfl2_60 TaxID=3088709 RepID=UPI0030D8529D
MPAIQRFSLPAYLLSAVLGLVLLTGLWYGLGKPVHLPDVASASHKMQCASYTPFGKDQSPFQKPLRISNERMDIDLGILAKRFDCLRTYSVTGLEALPDLARKHGLTLMIGAWVSRSPIETQIEIKGAIKAANANPDIVKAVIVGNETLLRKEVTSKQLVKLISQVKSQIKQPVTYADVWEFWLKHPEIAPAVDFLTIHLLPYWEDDPAGIDTALSQVAKVRNLFTEKFAPKDILIGETGWPSEGRQRETALPSRVNQAKFMRGFVTMAEENGWHYNLIEAFDQPWKRASEGAVGGYWGLYDADRNDKSVLAGSVSNLPDWPFWLGGSALLYGAILLLTWRPQSMRYSLLQPLLVAVGVGCMGLWAELSLITSRYIGEWLWAGALLVLNMVVLMHISLALSENKDWRRTVFSWLDSRRHWWLIASGFAGAVMMLALVTDARYRSFPSAALLLPAVVYLWRPVAGFRRETLALLLLIAAGIPLQLFEETLGNVQAIGWALVSALLGAALWRSLQQRQAQPS